MSRDGGRRREAVWSVSEELATRYYATFYGSTITGTVYFAICWDGAENFVRNVAAVTVSSAALAMVVLDGGTMLSDIVRERLRRKRQEAREIGRQEGRVEGRREGRQEGRREVLGKLKAKYPDLKLDL